MLSESNQKTKAAAVSALGIAICVGHDPRISRIEADKRKNILTDWMLGLFEVDTDEAFESLWACFKLKFGIREKQGDRSYETWTVFLVNAIIKAPASGAAKDD